MNFKRNGFSNPDIYKDGSDKQNLENNHFKMFNSINFNGFNTSRASVNNKELINNNVNDGMTKSKLKLMNSESPIKLKINKENDMPIPEINLINDRIESNLIKMDINPNNNFCESYRTSDASITHKKNLVGSPFDRDEDLISPKINLW